MKGSITKASRPGTNRKAMRDTHTSSHHPEKQSAADLKLKHKKLSEEYEQELQRLKELEDKLNRRKERYQTRELDYRKTISELQREIRIRCGYDVDIPNRKQAEIESLHGEINENIEGIQLRTAKIIAEQELEIERVYETTLKNIKRQLEDEKNRKMGSQADIRERENELA